MCLIIDCTIYILLHPQSKNVSLICPFPPFFFLSIDRWVSKMNAAVEPFGDGKPRESTQKRKKKEQLSQTVSLFLFLFS